VTRISSTIPVFSIGYQCTILNIAGAYPGGRKDSTKMLPFSARGKSNGIRYEEYPGWIGHYHVERKTWNLPPLRRISIPAAWNEPDCNEVL
jgi:hypothetical protein